MKHVRFCFAEHVLDVDLRELTRAGEGIAVEPQVFDLLIYLVENRERVVSKDDLIETHLGRPHRLRIDADQPNQRRAKGGRRQRQGPGRDPHHRAQGLSLRRRRAGAPGRRGTPPASGCSRRSQPDEPPHRQLPALDRTAIAVLPFVNISGEPEQEYFSEGISEDIITALSKLRWFYVIARNSSFIYKGKSVHHRQIGEELGVGYVVEGSVRKDGDQVRITAQLVDVATGSHLWAERYDRSLADVFAVQDEITQAVVAAIEPQLYAAEEFRARRKTPDNMDAWDLVMRALSHYWRVTRQDNLVAQALLEKAIAVDPGYGQALSLLASCHTFSAHMGWEDMPKAVPVAERAALAAIRADSEDAWAHYALASVYLFTRRFDDSIAEFELALRLNPNFSPARGLYGVALAYRGRWEDGDRAAREALRFSPRDPFAAIYCGVAAYCQYVGRNYDEAIRLSREVDAAAKRFLRRPPGADRGRRHGGSARRRESRVAGASPRAADDFAEPGSPSQMPFEHDAEREHYLEGFRRAGLK